MWFKKRRKKDAITGIVEAIGCLPESLTSVEVLAVQTVFLSQGSSTQYKGAYLHANSTCICETVLLSGFILRTLCLMGDLSADVVNIFTEKYFSCLKKSMSNLFDISDNEAAMFLSNRMEYYEIVFLNANDGMNSKVQALGEEFVQILLQSKELGHFESYGADSPLSLVGIFEQQQCNSEVFAWINAIPNAFGTLIETVNQNLRQGKF